MANGAPPKATKLYPRADSKRFEKLPTRLKALPQWVCWRSEPREGDKPAKIPVTPLTGKNADHANPSTWGTFDEACQAFEKNKKYAGIGFVFSAEDPFTGVDIDDCRDPKTGELGDWAQIIITGLASYTEVSPSATGVKLILEATVPGPSSRRAKIEMYSHSRYFTMTGEHVEGTPTEVEARQGELADLYRTVFGPSKAEAPKASTTTDPKLVRVRAIADEVLLQRARDAANGEKFTRLWQGELTDYAGDHSRADAALCSILSYWTRGDAPRVDVLFRQSALMRDKWDQRRGGETYGARTITRSISATTAMFDPDMIAAISGQRNDSANADIFVQLYEDRFRYCTRWKEWLAFNGNLWTYDADAAAGLACNDVSNELMRRCSSLPPGTKETMQAVKWAVGAGDDRRLRAIERMAKMKLEVTPFHFDREAYLLGCANGVLDLKTCELRPGERGDWILRTTGIAYRPGAECPAFDKFLSEIMEGRKEMIDYLWRVIGYSLTGDVTERAFFLLHGGGRNGKTTFVEALRAMLGTAGGYAQKARFSTFLRKHSTGGANDDVAHLAGARVVIASESDSSNPLDTALIKELTGNDAVRARFLYGKEFEFNPQFKLFLVTNHIPPIYESTHSLWDRLHYIGFNFRVPDEKVDRALPLKILGELEGILARAVIACREWQTEGLGPPSSVLKARKELEVHMDTFGEFLAECTKPGETTRAKVSHKALYHAFNWWARDANMQRIPSSKSLASYLRDKKFPEERSGANILHWLGITLVKAAPNSSEV